MNKSIKTILNSKAKIYIGIALLACILIFVGIIYMTNTNNNTPPENITVTNKLDEDTEKIIDEVLNTYDEAGNRIIQLSENECIVIEKDELQSESEESIAGVHTEETVSEPIIIPDEIILEAAKKYYNRERHPLNCDYETFSNEFMILFREYGLSFNNSYYVLLKKYGVNN